jgi:hypothetical protein
MLGSIAGIVLASLTGAPPAPAGVTAEGGADEHSIALWLFDETPYANVTLTDAGLHQIDLRLETGRERPLPPAMLEGKRGLVKGRFGNALHLPIGGGAGVSWPLNEYQVYGGKPHAICLATSKDGIHWTKLFALQFVPES